MNPHPSPPFDPWLWWHACQQTWLAALDPPGTGRRMREQRLGRLIEATLRDSPLYARRAGRARVLADFEPIGKAELMGHFDDWAADRRITLGAAESFIRSATSVADAWLDRYLLWTSSGTTGHPGIFVQDAASLAALDAIAALRLSGTTSAVPAASMWGASRAFAYVGAIGGPYAGHVSFERLRRIMPASWSSQVHLISVLEPLEQIALRLQSLQPQVLVTYPSCATALASWQSKLGLKLGEIWLGGEQLTAAQRTRLHQAFDCPVRNSYGASEFYSMAFECAEGRLHLNDDWVILEGIDAHGQAVPVGEFSHTTLLTNLANHVQPLLRYELSDRVRFVGEACACGCAFPVIEVQGRCDDVLTLPGVSGGTVTLLPLVLETVIEEDAGVMQFQLLLTADGALELRLPAGTDADTGNTRPAFERCRDALAAFFVKQGVKPHRLVHGQHEPLRQPGSGKLRRVIEMKRAD